MDNEFDFVPPVFLRAMVLLGGMGLAISLVLVTTHLTTEIAISFGRNLGTNLNRLGMIFEFTGLISLLPNFLKKKDAEVFNKRIKTLLKRTDAEELSLRKLIKTFSIKTITESSGGLGLVNQLSRTLGLITLQLLALIFPLRSLSFEDSGVVFWMPLIFGYLWLIIELANIVFKIQFDNDELSPFRFISFWFCGGIIFFVPVLLISLSILNLLEWISSHSLNTVIATLTFPFIFLGTVCQLIASFL
mgnify:CR=1 FL=1